MQFQWSLFQLRIIIAITSAAFSMQTFASFAPGETEEDIQKTIRFLTLPTKDQGITYVGTAKKLEGLILPYSYYSTSDYWGRYVCRIPNNNCFVTDYYNESDYTLTPSSLSPGADLQVERVNVANGTNIYDASTWQIALALAGHAGLKGPNGLSLFDIANNQNKLLQLGYDGNTSYPAIGKNRAITQSDETFSYNGIAIYAPQNAYFFRMVTSNWLSRDPLQGTDYQNYITAINLPENNPNYAVGVISWLDWKPITGENSWAFLLGSLQAAQIQYQAFPNTQNYVPYDAIAVQNALNVLGAFQAMQSPIGAIYYITRGSLGNTGPVDVYTVSVENNASALAGLLVLKNILLQESKFDSKADQVRIQNALNEIHIMINGGQLPNGRTTQGILNFFRNYAWDSVNGIFLQGGLANVPNKPVWQPITEPKAVDVNTWGVAVLGQPLIDKWYGFGSAYKVWKNVKTWGGFYGPNGELWGVGYSDQDHNGKDKNYSEGILSSEWTAGAITMVRALIVQYQTIETSTQYTKEEKGQAKQFVTELEEDQASMLRYIMSLRTDTYANESAFSKNRPVNFSELVPVAKDKLGFMYASKRYMIPFGWFANPLPSVAGTAWTVMLYYNFNPFSVDGSYQSNSFKENQ